MAKKDSRSSDPIELETNISFQLGDLQIALFCNTPLIMQFVRQFLQDWKSHEAGSAESNTIHIDLNLVETLPPLPQQPPIFVSDSHLMDEVGTLLVYKQANSFLLYFQDGGMVRINTNSGTEQFIQGTITPQLLKYGRLHDLIFTGLSYCLRKRGYYLIHAAAAVRGQEAVIFVGASGCGKSTTILNLALNQWELLSNDTLLLEERPDGIYALPTPGGLSIRQKSVSHIPALAKYIPKIVPGEFHHLSLQKIGLSYAGPHRISTIYFPEIRGKQENFIHPISPAVALAHLMESSLDRWDTDNLQTHISFLEQLSRQAKSAVLQIANQKNIPQLLTSKT